MLKEIEGRPPVDAAALGLKPFDYSALTGPEKFTKEEPDESKND
jgi:hypothetical protein